MQHRRYNDHYDRFLHYHCAALLEQITSSKNYSPTLTVFTIVISTSKSREEMAMAEINFDPFDFLTGQRLHKIHHRVLYLFPKHVLKYKMNQHFEKVYIINNIVQQQA